MCERKVKNGRRDFLRIGGVAALATAGSLLVPSVSAVQAAVDHRTLPKPQNQLSPEEAMSRLVEGNRRYVAGISNRHDFIAEREALVEGQNPFAAVLGCADSRIAPEYAFDAGHGDLFVVRVAGNFVNDDGVASLEYAVAVLGTPLIMVLGHESCGAVRAGVKRVKENTSFVGHIGTLADSMAPAVREAMKQKGDLMRLSIRQNVLRSVARLRVASPVLADALAANRLRVVGGVYELASGRVQILG